jgi:PBP1b-binding outer membrane lipoprotein LpoB
MRVIVYTAIAIILSGCVTPAIMQDPKTGAVHQCTGNEAVPLIAQNSINQCAAAYERLGWKRQ